MTNESSSSSSSSSSSTDANKGNANDVNFTTINPRIRRRNHNSSDNRDEYNTNNGNINAGLYYKYHNIADFQDGKRFSGAVENTNILKGTAEVFQNVSSRLGFFHWGPNNNRNQPKNDAHITGTNTKATAMDMNQVRLRVGLYQNFPLANAFLNGSPSREAAFRKSGHKQMNHVRGTDGWWRSMLVVEDRAMDNYLGPWVLIVVNALGACLLTEVWGVDLPEETIEHWDTVYSLVLKTSLAFLLVFRLNRCAMRYWEARGLWGNLTHVTRNLVGALLLYGSHAPNHRDSAVQWATAFCIAVKNFIRSDRLYNTDEFSGVLTAGQVARLRDSNHAPLFAASMCRHYLVKLFPVDETTPPGLAVAHSIRLQECERHVSKLVEQVSGMEKIRSTPLPIAYVAHLRTFLLAYCLFLPYVWVGEWSWITIPLVGFTAFALLGIEGASSEVEIPFSAERPNHLAMDAYCLVILDSVLGLVVHDANLHLQGRKGTLPGEKDALALAVANRNRSRHEHGCDSDDSGEEDNDRDEEVGNEERGKDQGLV